MKKIFVLLLCLTLQLIGFSQSLDPIVLNGLNAYKSITRTGLHNKKNLSYKEKEEKVQTLSNNLGELFNSKNDKVVFRDFTDETYDDGPPILALKEYLQVFFDAYSTSKLDYSDIIFFDPPKKYKKKSFPEVFETYGVKRKLFWSWAKDIFAGEPNYIRTGLVRQLETDVNTSDEFSKKDTLCLYWLYRAKTPKIIISAPYRTEEKFQNHLWLNNATSDQIKSTQLQVKDSIQLFFKNLDSLAITKKSNFEESLNEMVEKDQSDFFNDVDTIGNALVDSKKYLELYKDNEVDSIIHSITNISFLKGRELTELKKQFRGILFEKDNWKLKDDFQRMDGFYIFQVRLVDSTIVTKTDKSKYSVKVPLLATISMKWDEKQFSKFQILKIQDLAEPKVNTIKLSLPEPAPIPSPPLPSVNNDNNKPSTTSPLQTQQDLDCYSIDLSFPETSTDANKLIDSVGLSMVDDFFDIIQYRSIVKGKPERDAQFEKLFGASQTRIEVSKWYSKEKQVFSPQTYLGHFDTLNYLTKRLVISSIGFKGELELKGQNWVRKFQFRQHFSGKFMPEEGPTLFTYYCDKTIKEIEIIISPTPNGNVCIKLGNVRIINTKQDKQCIALNNRP